MNVPTRLCRVFLRFPLRTWAFACECSIEKPCGYVIRTACFLHPVSDDGLPDLFI